MISEASSGPGRRRPPRHPSSLHNQSPRFKGVRMRSWGRWVSEIRIPRSRDKIWLGSYSSPEVAARAYDTAYLLLRGPSASSSLNLSDSFHLVTPYLAAYTNDGRPITSQTIQTTAVAIANAIAGVENPLLSPAADEHGAETPQLDAERGEASCIKDGVSQNPMGETCLRDLVPIESRWIHDVMRSLSPRAQTSSRPFSALEAASNDIRLQGAGSFMSCSTNLDQQQLILSASFLDDQFHQGLAQDGFTPMSSAVTTRERFDKSNVAPPSDALWSYP